MAKNQIVRGVATTVYADTGKNGDRMQVFYHSTCVAEWDAVKIILRSGGWMTATTKLRMNQAANQFGLRFYVYQKDYEWYVTRPDGQTVRFTDGMVMERA